MIWALLLFAIHLVCEFLIGLIGAKRFGIGARPLAKSVRYPVAVYIATLLPALIVPPALPLLCIIGIPGLSFWLIGYVGGLSAVIAQRGRDGPRSELG